ncbi:maleylpyruvate isomerase family mycothiol-dependent enzyme [Streptomyces sp. SBT349]|uniref:maleylpyruvate isomerase family mycothiol-dependent enzyme n=1 Tax=Streptomyces sp. SBT349 TaxID=1580539 RepID=UPI00066C6831|nr:maleylpyruvate isomerase family mycothiol-dependent enzyme [Streptomyces sp. SBT349]
MSSTATTSGELRARIGEITDTHARLLADAAAIDDAAAREATGLPGWTRGHVLTHLGDLARAFARQARRAPEGRRVEVYDGGRPGRDAAIERGAPRPAAALREALEDGLTQLERAWAELTEADWSLPCAYRDSDLLATQLCWWREVHIHYADLGIGYRPEDWSDPLGRHVIGHLLPRLPADRTTVLLAADTGRRWEHGTGAPVTVQGTQNALAAWLAGRRATRQPEAREPGTAPPELGPWP